MAAASCFIRRRWKMREVGEGESSAGGGKATARSGDWMSMECLPPAENAAAGSIGTIHEQMVNRHRSTLVGRPLVRGLFDGFVERPGAFGAGGACAAAETYRVIGKTNS